MIETNAQNLSYPRFLALIHLMSLEPITKHCVRLTQ